MSAEWMEETGLLFLQLSAAVICFINQLRHANWNLFVEDIVLDDDMRITSTWHVKFRWKLVSKLVTLKWWTNESSFFAIFNQL